MWRRLTDFFTALLLASSVGVFAVLYHELSEPMTGALAVTLAYVFTVAKQPVRNWAIRRRGAMRSADRVLYLMNLSNGVYAALLLMCLAVSFVGGSITSQLLIGIGLGLFSLLAVPRYLVSRGVLQKMGGRR